MDLCILRGITVQTFSLEPVSLLISGAAVDHFIGCPVSRKLVVGSLACDTSMY